MGKDNKKSTGSEKVVARKKDLVHRYEVIERFEAGLELLGSEVKSLREGRVNLKDGYCKFTEHELYAVDMYIAPYSHATHLNHDPERPRKLLLRKRELHRLRSKVIERGLTIVPARLYFRGGKAKLEIALVKGKRVFDRREEIKRRDQDRDMEREIKKYK